MIAYRKLIEKHKTVLTEKKESNSNLNQRMAISTGPPKVHKSAQIVSKCVESSTQIIQMNNRTD